MKKRDERGHLLLWYRPRSDRPREYHFTSRRFRVLTVLLSTLGVLVVIAVLFYASLLRRAFEGAQLKEENRRLRAEVARVQVLQHDLSELQRFGKQLQRSLTEGADLERIIEASEAAGKVPANDSDGSWLPLTERDHVYSDSTWWRYALPGTASADGDIPHHWPAEGFITRGFEPMTVDPAQSHPGIDIAVPRGTPVKAAASGWVIAADWTPRFGHRVIIDHGGGVLSIYGHNELLLVSPGERVKTGTIIALSGTSGISTAPHLHFEVWIHGQAVDPLLLLQQPGREGTPHEMD